MWHIDNMTKKWERKKPKNRLFFFFCCWYNWHFSTWHKTQIIQTNSMNVKEQKNKLHFGSLLYIDYFVFFFVYRIKDSTWFVFDKLKMKIIDLEKKCLAQRIAKGTDFCSFFPNLFTLCVYFFFDWMTWNWIKV